MTPVSIFSLDPLPRKDSPVKSLLQINGVPTDLSIRGCRLLRQFETSDGFLLVTDFDCPFEESTCFTLINHAVDEILSWKEVVSPYVSYWLKDITWANDRQFTAYFEGCDDAWKFTIRPWGVPVVWPRLRMKRWSAIRVPLGVD